MTSQGELVDGNVLTHEECAKKSIDSLLKEYDRITAEIRSIQETQRRMVGFLPGALAVGLPLLLKPASEVPQELRIAIFLGFGYMFLLFVTNYVGLTRGILRLSMYQMQYIAPAINGLLPQKGTSLFQWEEYVRTNIRQSGKELVGFGLIHGAEFLLLSSPSIACFGIGTYYAACGSNFGLVFVCCFIYATLWGTTLHYAYLTVQQSKLVPKPAGTLSATT